MSHFTRKVPWTRNPSDPVGLDKSHPLYPYINKAILMPGRAVDVLEAANVYSTTTGYSVKPNKVISFAGTAGNKVDLGGPITLPGDEATVLIRAKIASTGNAKGLFGDKDATNWSSSNGLAFIVWGSNNPIFKVGTVEANATAGDSNTFHNYVGRYKTGEALEVWVDGVEASSYSAQGTGPNYTNSSVNTRLGTYYDAGADYSDAHDTELVLLFNKKLTDTELKDISANPWQVFQPQTQLIPYSTAAPPPAGLGIPLAAYHYNHNVGSNL